MIDDLLYVCFDWMKSNLPDGDKHMRAGGGSGGCIGAAGGGGGGDGGGFLLTEK